MNNVTRTHIQHASYRRTLDELVKEGTVETIGLSNFAAVEVTRIQEICKAKGLTAPTVFQGLYNPINRRVSAKQRLLFFLVQSKTTQGSGTFANEYRQQPTVCSSPTHILPFSSTSHTHTVGLMLTLRCDL